MQQKVSQVVNFYFIRHGETVDNITHTLQGHQPGKLTEKGMEDALQAGKSLHNVNFSKAYVSDLKRCVDSFLQIEKGINLQKNSSEYQIKIDVDYTPFIREIGLGVLENHKSSDSHVQKEVKKMQSDHSYKPLNGESWSEVEGRALKFWNHLVKGHLPVTEGVNGREENVLFVSHRGFLQRFLSVVYNHGNLDILNGVNYYNKSLNNCEYIVMSVQQVEQNQTVKVQVKNFYVGSCKQEENQISKGENIAY